jgi:hypothetical protein
MHSMYTDVMCMCVSRMAIIIMEGCMDGTLASTGQRLFECEPGRRIYYLPVNLQYVQHMFRLQL